MESNKHLDDEIEYLVSRSLEGHTSDVKSITQLNNGNLASASNDKSIKIWKLSTGECISTLKGHTRYVNCVIQLNDFNLASASADNSIKIWKLSLNQCITTLKGHTDYVNCVIQLNDCNLASSSWDKSIKIWNISTCRCITTLKGHNGHVNSVTQLNNGNLASSSGDTTIKIWNLSTGLCITSLEGHREFVNSVIQLKNGNLASSSGDTTIKIWNLSSGLCIATLEGHTDFVLSVIELSDGNLASASCDKSIKIWGQLGQCISTLKSHSQSIWSIVQLSDGNLASSSHDRSIKIWTGSKSIVINHLKVIEKMILSRNFDNILQYCETNTFMPNWESLLKSFIIVNPEAAVGICNIICNSDTKTDLIDLNTLITMFNSHNRLEFLYKIYTVNFENLAKINLENLFKCLNELLFQNNSQNLNAIIEVSVEIFSRNSSKIDELLELYEINNLCVFKFLNRIVNPNCSAKTLFKYICSGLKTNNLTEVTRILNEYDNYDPVEVIDYLLKFTYNSNNLLINLCDKHIEKLIIDLYKKNKLSEFLENNTNVLKLKPDYILRVIGALLDINSVENQNQICNYIKLILYQVDASEALEPLVNEFCKRGKFKILQNFFEDKAKNSLKVNTIFTFIERFQFFKGN